MRVGLLKVAVCGLVVVVLSGSRSSADPKGSVVVEGSGNAVNQGSGNLYQHNVYGRQKRARYDGEMEHLRKGQKGGFVEFVYQHDGEIVFLDTKMFGTAATPFDEIEVVDANSDNPWFVVFDDCEPGTVRPSTEGCVGIEFNVRLKNSSDAALAFTNGYHYLKGHFSVAAQPGMHQGYMAVVLTAAPPE